MASASSVNEKKHPREPNQSSQQLMKTVLRGELVSRGRSVTRKLR
ncbi:hypothetical protein E2C01_080290 [Portunus trituberculatus]|uniref:Uncharacterized protein n=1 Tax=Portunus trituberculatus TaxID=210409 RepID=A0A5B7IJB3_PORTR|nr:hypothetical protein [Portunus trituberculatus]